jgi:polar amino acid transport system substrate-binding protein
MRLVLFLFSLSTFNSLHAEVITMRTDLWCPYACDPKSVRPGFMVEIAREVFQKHHHTINYDVMNWPRAVADVKSGKYDALVGCSKTDVKGFVIPKIPTGIMESYYWTLKADPWFYKGMDSLKSKKIGVINDYTYGEAVDSLIQKKNPAFVEVSGQDPLIRLIHMTEFKRIDGFVENPLVLYYNLENIKKDKTIFKISSPDMASDPDLFIAFSPLNPKSKEYARILDEGMVEMRRSGKLKLILAKYGVLDWKK